MLDKLKSWARGRHSDRQDAGLAKSAEAKSAKWLTNPKIRLPTVEEQQSLGFSPADADILVYEQSPQYWAQKAKEKQGQPKVDPNSPRIIGKSQVKIAGGNADIFIGWDTRLARRVILKRVNNTFEPNTPERLGQEKQLLREAQLQAQINHENILSIYDMMADATGNLYLVLPEIRKDQGIDLFEWMKLRKRDAAKSRRTGETLISGPGVTPREFLQLIEGIAAAVEELNKRGNAHHDITPTNIMVKFGESGELITPIILDLGSANGVTKDSEVSFGSPHYMSPERLNSVDFDNDNLESEQRSELYSVASTLYYFLTVEPLTTGRDPDIILREKYQISVRTDNDQALARELTAWGLNVEQVDAMLVAFETALQFNPNDRYASTTEFAQVIRSILDPVISERKVETNVVGNRLAKAVRMALLGQKS